jgi:hypothetical protein
MINTTRNGGTTTDLSLLLGIIIVGVLMVSMVSLIVTDKKDKPQLEGMIVHIKDTNLNATVLGRPTDTYRCWDTKIYLCRIDHGEQANPRFEVVPFNKSDLILIKERE